MKRVVKYIGPAAAVCLLLFSFGLEAGEKSAGKGKLQPGKELHRKDTPRLELETVPWQGLELRELAQPRGPDTEACRAAVNAYERAVVAYHERGSACYDIEVARCNLRCLEDPGAGFNILSEIPRDINSFCSDETVPDCVNRMLDIAEAFRQRAVQRASPDRIQETWEACCAIPDNVVVPEYFRELASGPFDVFSECLGREILQRVMDERAAWVCFHCRGPAGGVTYCPIPY